MHTDNSMNELRDIISHVIAESLEFLSDQKYIFEYVIHVFNRMQNGSV